MHSLRTGTATPQAPGRLSGSKCGFQLDCPPSAFLPSFPGDSAANAAFVYLWVSVITERGRGVGPRLNQVTLPSLVLGYASPPAKETESQYSDGSSPLFYTIN